MKTEHQPVTLPELQYGYHDLEPVLVGEIIEIHHKKHHQKYVDEYNRLSQELVTKIQDKSVHEVQKLCDKVAFNVGGHVAHKWYWENLAPARNGGGVLPDEKSNLSQAIVKSYGSFDNFVKKFNEKTKDIQGSGWGWLAYCPTTHGLSIEETRNQDLIETKGLIPLLTVDVWEHAYHIQYKNLRPDYLANIWQVMNWRCVEDRYNKASNFQKL